MGNGEVQIGPTDELLSEASPTALYGIDVHLIKYRHHGVARPNNRYRPAAAKRPTSSHAARHR